MSPRNSAQTPSTPSRAQSAETPKKSLKVQQTKEDEAHVKQKNKKDFKVTELLRHADVLPTSKICSKTEVM